MKVTWFDKDDKEIITEEFKGFHNSPLNANSASIVWNKEIRHV